MELKRRYKQSSTISEEIFVNNEFTSREIKTWLSGILNCVNFFNNSRLLMWDLGSGIIMGSLLRKVLEKNSVGLFIADIHGAERRFFFVDFAQAISFGKQFIYNHGGRASNLF